MKKLFYSVTLLSFITLVSLSKCTFGQSWQLYGPDSVDANNICFNLGKIGLDVICDSAGFYINDGPDYKWNYYTNGGLIVKDATPIDSQNVMLVMGDGTFSDGIYNFNLTIKISTALDFIFKPNFVTYNTSNNKYYAGYESGLKSSSNGVNWASVGYFDGKTCKAIAYYEDNIVISTLNDSNGVHYSTDNGQTWNYSPGSPHLFDMGFTKKGKLYGIIPYSFETSGLYSSNNYGKIWQREYYSENLSCVGFDALDNVFVGYEIPLSYFRGIAIYDSLTEALYFKNDGLPCLNINKIKLNPTMSSIAVFCCTDSGVYVLSEYLTSIQENSSNHDKLTIYPNPFNDKTTVEFSLSGTNKRQVLIQFSDINGHIVHKKKVEYRSGVMHYNLNGSGLKSGIYFCNIRSEKTTISNVMIKL